MDKDNLPFILHHEARILDSVIWADIAPSLSPESQGGSAFFSTGWTAFLVANRLHEQLCKLLTPDLQPRGKGGVKHRIKTNWYEVLKARGSPPIFLEQLKKGYAWFQAMFQTPWGDLSSLYDEVEKCRNDNEYALLNMSLPDQPSHSGVHPLLPCVMSDLSHLMMSSLRLGNHAGGEFTPELSPHHASISKLKRICTINRPERGAWLSFESTSDNANAGENAIDLLNDVHRKHGKTIGLFTVLFNRLGEIKRAQNDGGAFNNLPVRFDDGTRINLTRKIQQGCEYPHEKAMPILLDVFQRHEGISEFYRIFAEHLLNKPDWRLQMFIRMSEHGVLKQQENGMWFDSSGGAWRKNYQWGMRPH